jgi:RsiW-degrading membrane proteinase PrsW (M82 family)
MHTKNFWLANNLALLALYGWATWLCSQGQSGHWAVWIAALVLAAHALEIPLAFQQLKQRAPSPLRVVLGTLLFGFTWWLPAKRGLYAVK